METSVSTYRQLAAVEILHHHFLDENGQVFNGTNDLPPVRKAKRLAKYDVREWLRIEPDTATQAAMETNGLVLKATKMGFVLITSLASSLPPPAPDAGTRKPLARLEQLTLRFLLRWTDPAYATITALAHKSKPKEETGMYLFGNQWARFFGATPPFLSLPLPPYRPIEQYLPGDVVKDGNQHFLAIAKSQGVATGDSAFWRVTDSKINYASRENLRPRERGLPPGVWGKIELMGKSGLGNYSILTVAGDIKAAQIFRIHLDKM